VVFVLLGAVAPAAESPFTGTWKANESRGKGARVVAMRIEVDDTELRIDYESIGAEGKRVQSKLRASFGGNLNGVIGSPEMDAVRCWRSDEHTILIKMSRGADTVGWQTLEVPKNGRTLRFTHALVDARGKESKTVTSFERQ